jgi:exosortase/archaeosortase family protein
MHLTSKKLGAKSLYSFLSWTTVFLVARVAAIFYAVWATFSNILVPITDEAIGESGVYFLAIVFLFFFLIFHERKMLSAVVSNDLQGAVRKPSHLSEIIGALLSLLAFLLHWLGFYSSFSLELDLFSLPLLVAGLVLLLFNVSTLKTLALPIILLGFLGPSSVEFINTTGTVLANLTSKTIYTVLNVLGFHLKLATQSGLPVLLLEKPTSPQDVLFFDVRFIGAYPLAIFTILWVFFVFVANGSSWKKVIIFLSWFPLILIFNTLRAAIMTVVAYDFGISAANDGLYIFGGWFVTLLGAFFILWFLSEKTLKIQFFARRPQLTSCPDCEPSVKSESSSCPGCGRFLRSVNHRISRESLFKVVTLVIIVSLTFFLGVPAFAFDNGKIQIITYLPREGIAINSILPEISGYALSFGYPDNRLEAFSPNASLTYVYTLLDGSNTTIYGAININASKRELPLKGKVLDSRDALVLENPSITGKVVSLQEPNSTFTLVMLYWYERAILNVSSTAVSEEQMRISVFEIKNNSTDYADAEVRTLRVGQFVASYLEPPRAWSYFSSLFPENLLGLIIIVIGVLAFVSIVRRLDSRRERKLNLFAFNKLGDEGDKNVLRAVYQTGKIGKSTFNAISASLQDLAGKQIDQEGLINSLTYAEELGLVKNAFVDENGVPRMMWKTQIAFPGPKSLTQRIRDYSKRQSRSDSEH